MSTPGGLVDKQELIDAQLDTAHLGRVVNSKDASGNPIDTSTNRTGGVNKTLDALETEYLEAIRAAGGSAINGGVWAAGQTFTAYNQFMVYNGIPYKPLTTTSLPYGPTGASPDVGFVGPYVDIGYGDVTVSFGEISDIDGDSRLTEGMLLSVEDYVTGYGSGRLYFKVVAAGTGVADGGKYIDLPVSGFQLEQNLQIPVRIKAFGVSGANLTSNSERIQKCIEYCFDNDVSLYGCRDTLNLQEQIYIPQHDGGFAGLDSIMTLDFGGARFVPTSNGTVLESGEFVGGVWVSTIEQPTGYKNSFNLEITNFSIVGGDYGIRLNNLHQGCKLHKIASNNCNTIVDLNHCFYLITDRVTSFSSQAEPWTDERFIIRGDSNLMSLTNCVAINSNIGYKFDNAAGFAAITFENNSVEGVNIGLEFDGIVNSLGVKDCYFENVVDVCMKFTTGVRSTIIENNFFNINNRPNTFIFETAANGGSILFDSSNETLGHPEERLFKDSGTVIGTSTIDRGNGQANNLDDLVVNSEDYPRNVVLDGFLNIGIDEAVAKRNRGIIPSNYSGRTTKGYVNANNYGFSLASSTATTAAIETRISSQDRQFVFFAFRTNEGGSFISRIGFIIGGAYWKFSGAGLAIDPDVTISSDSDGYIQINLSNLTNFTALIGGEIRVI